MLIAFSYYATFAQILPLLFCFIFGCYHVYRVCCKTVHKPRTGKMEVRQRSTEIIQLTVEQDVGDDDVSPYFWTPASIIAIVMTIYTLVHAIILTDGFLSTCKQYRNRVVKYVHATGQMVSRIKSQRNQKSTIHNYLRWAFCNRDWVAEQSSTSWIICMKTWALSDDEIIESTQRFRSRLPSLRRGLRSSPGSGSWLSISHDTDKVAI